MEPTTTEVLPEDGGVQPEPDQVEDTPAANSQDTPTVPDQAPQDQQPSPEPDDTDLQSWAQKKNLPLDDPMKMAKMVREAEQRMHDATSKSKLQGTLAQPVLDPNTDPVMQRLARLELAQEVSTFYAANPEARQLDTTMAELVEQRPWLANDLEALYALAVTKQSAGDRDALKAAGGREALTRLASTQRTAAVQPAATTPTLQGDVLTAENLDAKVASMSMEEYRARKPEIDAIMARR